jgi:hypothetical protein
VHHQDGGNPEEEDTPEQLHDSCSRTLSAKKKNLGI